MVYKYGPIGSTTVEALWFVTVLAVNFSPIRFLQTFICLKSSEPFCSSFFLKFSICFLTPG
uniref:Uncharacterized protein n=1 Tax=Brassica oleracea TaxID=3712 RepID=A0A3P6EJJ9_BRAOL|nr:unnamed protein product [Brassica oleracea]